MESELKHRRTENKAVIDRIARLTGHMQSVKRMVEEGKDCSEILIQLAAIRAAINGVGRIILQDHIDFCVIDAVKHGDTRMLSDLGGAIDKFFK